MREADRLYEGAIRKAWAGIDSQAAELAAKRGWKLVPLSIAYDPLPGESIIDELPDLPKSSRPEAVAVAVRLSVTFRLE